jgi:hypothetical protein
MAAPTTGLIVLYKCDETGTTAPQDSAPAGNANNLGCAGTFGTNHSYSTVDGQNRLVIDGSGSWPDFCLSATDTDITLSAGQDVTLSAWIKPYDNAAERCIMRISTAGDYLVWYRQTNKKYKLQLDGGNREIDYVHENDSMEHITIVFDATNNTLKLYSNGDLKATTSSVTENPAFTNAEMEFGHRDYARIWNGAISHFRLYCNYGADATNVGYIYAEDSPATSTPSTTPMMLGINA